MTQKLNGELDKISDSQNCTNPAESEEHIEAMRGLLKGYTPIEEDKQGAEETIGVVYTPSEGSGWANSDWDFISQLHLNMDGQVVDVPVENNLISIITEKYQERKPFLTYFWTPHQLHDPRSGISLTRMQMLDWEGSCNQDPTLAACLYPSDRLQSFYSTSLRDSAPLVFDFLKAFRYRSNSGLFPSHVFFFFFFFFFF